MAKKKTPAPPEPAPPPDTLTCVPVASILPSPTNPRKRFDEAGIAELAESLRTKGLLQPLLLRPAPGFRLVPGRQSGQPGFFWENQRQQILFGFCKDEQACRANPPYELIAGERRWRAARLAGLERVPAIVRDLGDVAVLEVQIVENEQRQDVTPGEKADGYAALVEGHGVKVEVLAARVGKSPSVIRGLLKLRQLPPAAREALDAGRLPASTAQLIARIPDPKSREEAAGIVLGGNVLSGKGEPMSYRDTKVFIEAKYMVELKGAAFDQDDKNLVEKAGSCTDCPKRAGNNPEYEGVRADVCTDPVCYRAKIERHGARLELAAQEKGHRVLPQEEARRLYRWGQLEPGSSYVELDSLCYDQDVPTGSSWRALVGKELKREQTLAIDERGQPHWLVPKSRAREVLQAKRPRLAQARDEQERQQEAARPISEWDVKHRAEQRLLALHGAAVRGLRAEAVLVHLGSLLVQRYRACGADVAVDLASRLGLADQPDLVADDEIDALLAGWLDRATPADLAELLAWEVAMYDSGDRWQFQAGKVDVEVVLDLVGQSHESLMAVARAELEAERATPGK